MEHHANEWLTLALANPGPAATVTGRQAGEVIRYFAPTFGPGSPGRGRGRVPGQYIAEPARAEEVAPPGQAVPAADRRRSSWLSGASRCSPPRANVTLWRCATIRMWRLYCGMTRPGS